MNAGFYGPPGIAVVGLDGGRLHLRIDKKQSDERRTRQYSTDQCEPKLFAIYTIDEKGNKERKSDVFYDGTLQSSTDLFTFLKLRLKQLGVRQARVLVITGDGASWIWNGVPELRRDLALTNLRVVEIVDWAHATGKLMPAAKAGLPEPEQQKWFKRMRTLLKQGLTVRPFFSEFRKFQHIVFSSITRFLHFWGKLTDNLPPKLQATEEGAISIDLVISLETKLPNLRTSFQNKRTVSKEMSVRLSMRSRSWTRAMTQTR